MRYTVIDVFISVFLCYVSFIYNKSSVIISQSQCFCLQLQWLYYCHQFDSVYYRGYMWNKIIPAFADIRLKYFYFSAWKLAWNYFKIISEPYCSSWLFSIMLSVSEIILIWSLLWANVYDILRRCRRPLVVSNALTQLCISCFIPDIRAVKVALRLGIRQKRRFSGPRFLGAGDTPDSGHAFSKRTHFRVCGQFWLSSVQRVQRVWRKKKDGTIAVKPIYTSGGLKWIRQ